MKNKKSILLTVVAIVLTLCVSTFAVLAAENEYEGSDLPVSESYVLRALNQLEARINAKIDALEKAIANRPASPDTNAPTTEVPPAQTEAPETTAPDTDTDTDTDTVPAPTVDYSIVYLTKGQALVGNCEFILRSGTATALCPGLNGLSDLTAGADLPAGTSITQNHLLLIPRNDGRGVVVTSADAYFMVRGTYAVETP